MTALLGVIADDLTGATDVANTLVKRGMNVIQTVGVPATELEGQEAHAIVVALKSRTCPAGEAVSESLAAARWLFAKGVRQILFKYCSTFDSTEAGNIGPVADALLDALEADFALVCPASPENGRTIYNGHLFVGEQLLSESPMRHHPLTPMRESNLIQLMDAQSANSCGLINLNTVRRGADAVHSAARELSAQGYRYGVIDALDEDDLVSIGAAAADHRLVTGAAGMAIGLPANFGVRAEDRPPPRVPGVKGRSLVLAGSCSAATRAQIESVAKSWPNRKLDIRNLASGRHEVDDKADWASRQPGDTPVLVFGSSDPDEVERNQQEFGVAGAGELMESGLASVAEKLVSSGFNRIVVAGGETSGAVIKALGVTGLRIGPEIEPGVPWTQTIGGPPIALALKSGNFGGPDFFANAFRMLP